MNFRTIRGEPLQHWIYAGPFDLDVSGRYHTHYELHSEAYEDLILCAKSAVRCMVPKENQKMELLGQTHPWLKIRMEPTERMLTWACYGVHARLMVTYAHTLIRSDRQGGVRFAFHVSGSAGIWLNQRLVFEHTELGRVESKHDIVLELNEGWNELTIMLLNVHGHCINAFGLTCLDLMLETELPLILAAVDREELEREFELFHLNKSYYHHNDPVYLSCIQRPAFTGKWKVSVSRGGRSSLPGMSGASIVSREFTSEDLDEGYFLCMASELPLSGAYKAVIHAVLPEGEEIVGSSLPFGTYGLEELPELDSIADKKKWMLERMSMLPDEEMPYRPLYGLYRELARMASDQWSMVDWNAVRECLSYIENRFDCADFSMHALLRMAVFYAERGWWKEPNYDSFKKVIVGFKYGEEDAGRSMMFTRSENHRFLFASAEYLAGSMYPDEIFEATGMDGCFHAKRGRESVLRWIKEKGSYGFTEWHSNMYYEEDMLGLMNLADLSKDPEIQKAARGLLDVMGMMIASQCYRGVFATTHGRCYEENLLHPESEPLSHMNWLLFGKPNRTVRKLSMGAVILSVSRYEPSPQLMRIAESKEPVHTLTVMGKFTPNGDGVRCSTYRTEDYMVSGIVESRKGLFGSQVQAGQVMLGEGIPVFVTSFDSRSETTRPSYWGGQYRMPKTAAWRNVLAYMYRLEDERGGTHCYFPMKQMDRVWRQGKWLFASKGNSLLALYSLMPYTEVESGAFKDRELLCLDRRNIWILEAGSLAEWGTLERFVEAYSDNRIAMDGEDLIYRSPSQGEFRYSWDQPVQLNGKPLITEALPYISNPFAYGEYGSGLIQLSEDDKPKLIDFTQIP